MWERVFEDMVRKLIRAGTLEVTLASGRRFRAGIGTPEIAVTLHDDSLPRRILMDPDLGVAEGYMDGQLTIEGDDLRGFLRLAIANTQLKYDHWSQWMQRQALLASRRWHQLNPAGRSRRNVAHHYDLSSELYDIFLDADRQYSCAYFREPDMTLEAAQEAKKQHIAKKLRLEPGMRVLDIGCGWGGMALTLARDHGAQVVGVTLSEEQHRIATERARAAGLSDRIDIRLSDYRAIGDRFDRVVSVGMFEHVGAPNYPAYFAKVSEVMPDDGVALIHTIGRTRPRGYTHSFVRRYIFPGGYIPALSEIAETLEHGALQPLDIEVWRLHYARTLRHWSDRFEAGIDRARALYDERFCRMWRYYLAASEISFEVGRQVVFQLQLSRRKDAVPITRDYMTS